MIEIKMPRLSDTMEEGAISTWRKQPGDTVAVGDVLVEIETDKAVMEYEAYEAGTLAQILVPEGKNADIGAPIALLDDGAGGPALSVSAAFAPPPSPAERSAPAPAAPTPAAAPAPITASSPAASAAPASAAPAPAASSPAANVSANGGSASGASVTGGDITGGDITGASVTGASVTGASVTGGSVTGAGVTGRSVTGGSVNGVGRLIASPLVRKLVRENHLDLSHVTGSGPGGRIIRADISGLLGPGASAPAPGASVVSAAPADPAAAADQPGAAPVTAAPAAAGSPESSATAAAAAVPAGAAAESAAPEADEVRGTRGVPISQVRRVIARRLSASAREIPHFYVTAVADAQALMDLRTTLNAQLTEAGRAKVSVNDLLIRACALALREHPDVNVSYGGDASGVMLFHDRINVGVAVAAESGLIVPVIRDADTKTVTQLGAESRKLAALAAERKLAPAQTSGGTFTISNLGMFGVEHFTAIINPPESAILAVGATTREPTVVGDTVEPRYRLRYTLSVDHRVVDGALAAKFLQTLTNLIEHPWMIIA